jgi:phasin family protein
MIQQQQAYFLELYRAGMRTASDIARASIETTQRLHAQQAEAMREALDENQRSARELGEVRSLDQLMALQTRLASEQMQRTAETWSRLWRTASESQTAMIEKVQQYGARTTDDSARFAASQAASAANTAGSERSKQERKSA